MSIAYIASAAKGSPDAGSSNYSTAAISTIGANLILIGIGSAPITGLPTDVYGNTYTALNEYNSNADAGKVKWFYCLNPIVGASHTFSYQGSNWSSMAAIAFSTAKDPSPIDQQNGYTGGSPGDTIQPGSVTPLEDNEWVITLLTWVNSGRTIGIDSGFTIRTQRDYGTDGVASFGIAIATLGQTTATPVNPTWSLSTYYYQASSVVTIKASASGGGGSTSSPKLLTLGMG
jgi:hypothetical protein